MLPRKSVCQKNYDLTSKYKPVNTCVITRLLKSFGIEKFTRQKTKIEFDLITRKIFYSSVITQRTCEIRSRENSIYHNWIIPISFLFHRFNLFVCEFHFPSSCFRKSWKIRHFKSEMKCNSFLKSDAMLPAIRIK